MRLRKLSVTLALATFAALLSFYLWRSLSDYRQNLRTVWEGLSSTANYRDVGESLNQCLGKPLFKVGKLRRSNREYSGWSCEKVGNPDVIVSLNFQPEAPASYYCRQDDGSLLVATHAKQSFEFDNIEGLEQWQNLPFRQAICQTFEQILSSLVKGDSVLVHCEAGRDRTGTVTAMLAAMAGEQSGMDYEALLDAIECDYRKSPTLAAVKYGRMKSFLTTLGPGGVSSLLQKHCGISMKLITKASLELR